MHRGAVCNSLLLWSHTLSLLYCDLYISWLDMVGKNYQDLIYHIMILYIHKMHPNDTITYGYLMNSIQVLFPIETCLLCILKWKPIK